MTARRTWWPWLVGLLLAAATGLALVGALAGWSLPGVLDRPIELPPEHPAHPAGPADTAGEEDGT
jgi:hypothetical protein